MDSDTNSNQHHYDDMNLINTGWVKVDATTPEELLPQDPTKEFLVMVSGVRGYMMIARYSEGDWYYYTYDELQQESRWEELEDVTHYANIPRPTH